MQGWLIVNPFLDTQKFQEIYGMLCAAAEKEHIRLDMKTTAQLKCPVGASFDVLPDFAVFWDKDVYLARQLEMAGLRLFNSAFAVEACDNKALTALHLSAHQLPAPDTILSPKTFEAMGYCNLSFLDAAEKQLGYPMVIKEAYGSFGQQVYLAKDRQAAEKIIGSLGYKDFIMQKYISTSHGRDIRVNVVGNRVIASMLRYNENDFRSNISNGGSMAPYIPNAAQEKAALDACRALKLDFAGVDVMFGENDEPIICEVNSNPHFKSTLQATGIDLSSHIMHYIREAITCGA